MTQNTLPKGNGKQIVQPSIDDDDEQSIDVKKIIFAAIRFWPYFVLSLLIGLGGAFLINRYTTKIYSSQAVLLLNQEGQSNSGIESLMTKIGYYNPRLEFENEVIDLKSFEQNLNAIKNLNFEVEYFQVGQFKTTELYQASPFTVIYDSGSDQLVDVDIEFKSISLTSFQLEAVSIANAKNKEKIWEK